MIANCIFATTIALAISTLLIFPGTAYFLEKQSDGMVSGYAIIIIYMYGTPIISAIVVAATVFKVKANGKTHKPFF